MDKMRPVLPHERARLMAGIAEIYGLSPEPWIMGTDGRIRPIKDDEELPFERAMLGRHPDGMVRPLFDRSGRLIGDVIRAHEPSASVVVMRQLGEPDFVLPFPSSLV